MARPPTGAAAASNAMPASGSSPAATGPPASAAVAPAVLAAVAEAGVVFLPVELIARSTPLDPTGGPLAWYPLFLALFAGGVAVATLFRARRGTPALVAAGCVLVGALQAVVWGSGGGTGAFVAIGLSLGAGVRVATLALRDWRDPIDASFGWGAGILLGEVAIARATGWGAVLWPVVALFFAGSLGSRAASVRLVERSVRGAAAGGDSVRRWRLVAAGVAAGGAAAAGMGVLLGTQRGPVGVVADLLVRAGAWLIYYAALVVGSVVSWVFAVLGLDRDKIQSWISHLRSASRNLGRGHGSAAGAAPLWERATGVLIFFLLVAGLVMLILRQRRRAREAVRDAAAWAEAEGPDEGLFVRAAEARRQRRRARELPEDAVRRLYAQALVELEERGRPRPVQDTPGEFLHVVRRDLPECSAGFTVLTRAYEDVRYGRIALDRTRMDSLEAEWTLLRRAIRAAPLPVAGGDADEAEAIATHLAERAEGAAGTAPSSDETFERR
jgi:preprotein translocase subunit SecG